TKTVIANCSPSTLWPIHLAMGKQERMGVNGLLKLELFQVPEDRSPWSENSRRVSELSWTNRSGFKTIAAGKDVQGHSFEVNSEVFASAVSQRFQGQIAIEYDGGDQSVFSMNSSFLLRSGQPRWLARFDLAGKGYDLVLSGALERLDGGSISDHVLVPEGNDIRRIHHEVFQSELQPVGDGMMVNTTFSSVEVERFRKDHLKRGSDAPAPDPFAPEDESDEEAEPFPEIEVPKELVGIMGKTTLDMSSLVYPLTGAPSEDGFAGYDLRRGMLVYFTKNKNHFSLMEGMFLPICRLPRNLVVISSGDGRLRLMGRLGEKTRMDVKRDGVSLFALEMEPVLGENGFIESSFDYSDEVRGLKYEGTMTFQEGRDTQVVKGDRGDLTIRAEVISTGD
ncbi:MAG TPA: hypothetical protein VM511_00415, partial [Luteolibacter sp.]|nr:hypothetical protein [Luteolibacter sp.]